MRISIVGWYGMNNVGDEAFRFVFPQFFAGHEIEFVRPPNKCNNPDIVVLGGGAVASPFYFSIMPNCPRYALGIDIAFKSEIDLLAKENFKEIYVRNGTDIPDMQNKLACPAHNIPDLAFLIQPTGNKILHKYKKYPDKKTLGVLVTDYVNPAIDRNINQFSERANSFKVSMAKELDTFQKQGYEILLIPCSTGGYGDDRRINLDLAAFMSSQPTNILDTINPQDMIDLIAELDITICQRFHAHVFSIIAGTPFVSIDFTRKVQLLLEENNLTYTGGAKFEGKVFDVSRLAATFDTVESYFDKQYSLALAKKYRLILQGVIEKVQQDWLQ